MSKPHTPVAFRIIQPLWLALATIAIQQRYGVREEGKLRRQAVFMRGKANVSCAWQLINEELVPAILSRLSLHAHTRRAQGKTRVFRVKESRGTLAVSNSAAQFAQVFPPKAEAPSTHFLPHRSVQPGSPLHYRDNDYYATAPRPPGDPRLGAEPDRRDAARPPRPDRARGRARVQPPRQGRRL